MPAGVDLPDLCDRLQRDANARGVLVLADDGEILGYSGDVAHLPELAIDAVADLVADLQRRPPADGEDRVLGVAGAPPGTLSACAAPLGRAALVVLFDGGSTLQLVRLRMKRARDLLLRSLDAR